MLGKSCLRYLSFRDSNRVCVCVCVCVCVLVAQLCLTLCNPMDCSPPGSSVHGILHASILERVAIPFSRGSFQHRDWTWVSCIAGRCFTIWAIREALPIIHKSIKISGFEGIRKESCDQSLVQGSHRRQCNSELSHLLNELWGGCLTSLSLRFHTYKKGYMYKLA